MNIPFYKYQGTGNDFVLIDQRHEIWLSRSDENIIRRLCDRKFGIGADGLILLQEREAYDFEMVYFNADGRESSMCGNGGRCIAAFARHLGVVNQTAFFLAIDGDHEAEIRADNRVALRMTAVEKMEQGTDHFILDTGSPHYVIPVEDIHDINVVENGRAIRYSERFKEVGINVNFMEIRSSEIAVATYERGVEDETLSCGTGVTASAISAYVQNRWTGKQVVDVETKGGRLQVQLECSAAGTFDPVWLIGPAEMVFEGLVSVNK